MNDQVDLPKWLQPSIFNDILQDIPGFVKIINFDAKPSLGAGENYASAILRINIVLELQDDATDNISFIMKIPHDDAIIREQMKKQNPFHIESGVYNEIIPELEEMYKNVGVEFKFGAKNYKLNINEDYVLLEDLKKYNFKSCNRFEGLDLEHTKSALRKLAQWHSATATRIQVKGIYKNINTEGFLPKDGKEMLNFLLLKFYEGFQNALHNFKGHEVYKDAVVDITTKMMDIMYNIYDDDDADDFKVLNHGDCWINNIMFQYNDEDEITDTYLIDFQSPKYGTPAQDLYFFILSSTNLDIKVKEFDYLIKYYHDHLCENLKLLKYPKSIPTLKDLHITLLKYGIWGYYSALRGMAAALTPPSDLNSLQNFMNDNEEGVKLRTNLFAHERYCQHANIVLPWLYYRGAIDY